jgi:hypothetical protein
MFKDILFKVATPLACALAIAFAPIGVSAAQYYNNYNNNNCCAQDCCDPCCQQDPCCSKKSSWLGNAAIFLGAAAVGAIAGVAAAESNKKRGRTGAQGEQGIQGVPGVPGAGFTLATVPGTATPITSLTFTFTTRTPFAAPGSLVNVYVTTPDGRTFFGINLDAGTIGATVTVTIPSGPFFVGQYNVGVIVPAGLVTTPEGLVSAELTLINGVAPSTPFDDAGIIVALTLVTATDKFFNAQYPFPETP